jgi:RNA polymerase sigma factor (sigma-70 family)
MTADGDREVILRSRDRAECFEVIFERHYAGIYRYVRRRLGEDLAQELAAETFAQAFRARRRFDGREQSALPWLYGITANLLRMNHRSEERRLRAYARAAQPDGQPSPNGDVDARLDAVALASRLAEALASLSSGQREVLLLHAWAELTHEQIAEVLDISPGTVRTRLHRARQHVAEQLAAIGNKGSDGPRVDTRTTR